MIYLKYKNYLPSFLFFQPMLLVHSKQKIKLSLKLESKIYILINFYCFSMMVNVPVLLCPHLVNVCVQEHLTEGQDLTEDEPNINHLNIGGGRKASRDADKEGRKNKEGCQVDADNSFEKERFEEVCNVNNGENQHSRQVCG